MTYEAGLLKQESTTLRQPVSTEQTKMCSVPNKYLTSLIFEKVEKRKKTEIASDVFSVCRFKSQPYLALSSGISIVWRADS